MEKITKLKNCKTIDDLEKLLGKQDNRLRRLLYKGENNNKYHSFTISKKMEIFDI